MTDELRTDRLLLPQWRDADLDPWAAMNADPQVREFLGGAADPRAERRRRWTRFRADLDERGWGWWAVEVVGPASSSGSPAWTRSTTGMPVNGVEIGWRLARAVVGPRVRHRGRPGGPGRTASTSSDLPEILAIAAAGNVRSHAVMRRLGMTHDPAEDFET